VPDLRDARSANLFATPLLSHIWAAGPQLNPKLRALILEHERRHRGTASTKSASTKSAAGIRSRGCWNFAATPASA
jgi:hypothetical protein